MCDIWCRPSFYSLGGPSTPLILVQPTTMPVIIIIPLNLKDWKKYWCQGPAERNFTRNFCIFYIYPPFITSVLHTLYCLSSAHRFVWLWIDLNSDTSLDINFSRPSIDRGLCPILPVVISLTENYMSFNISAFASETWFDESGLAVSSRVSRLILDTQAGSSAYLRDSTPCSGFPVHPEFVIYYTID